MIEIIDYQERWPSEFRTLAHRMRGALGSLALRIDHIGSTAVPGLAGKDVIDVQITVRELSEAVERGLQAAGFVPLSHITRDHAPPGIRLPSEELEKRLFGAGPDERRANVHVRVDGRFNQRYALLCRDHLRAHPLAAAAYGEVKRQLARHLGHDAEALYDVKDPVFDLLMAAAEDWASATSWRPGRSDG